MYNKILGRNPESAGQTFFLNVLMDGYQSQRYFTALAISNSTEYRTDYIKTSFTLYLGRQAGTGDINYWLSQFGSGVSDQLFIADLAGSSEYFGNPKKGNNNNLTWLQSAFKDILGQTLDANSQDFFMSELSSGTSLTSAAFQMTSSQAFDNTTVVNLFKQYLNRSPSGFDLAYWSSQLQAGLTIEQVLSQITSSQEYFFDAQQ